MSTRNFIRRDLPLILIVIAAVLQLGSRYIQDATLDAINKALGQWSSYITMMAWGLAVIYLFQGEWHTMQMKPGWEQKALFGVLVAFSLILVGGSIIYADWAHGQLGFRGDQVQWWYTAFYPAESRAFYGLMFLYLMSASYRMLRFRSLEATVLAVSGLLYVCESASIFTLYLDPYLTAIGEWLYNYPNNAATTAAVMVMACGSILISMRQLMGRERTAVEVAS